MDKKEEEQIYNLFIFRRDLRLKDNKGLNYAIKNYKNILPIFIFTPEQVTEKNKYLNKNSIQFMCECLTELNKNLNEISSKLHIFFGDNIEILNDIIKNIKISNIIFNMDYTPYAIKRDNDIKELCKNNNINCDIIEDYLLCKIGTLKKKDGNPYRIYTGFKKNGYKYDVDKPKYIKLNNLRKININNEKKIDNIIEYDKNKNILVKGGRINGLKQLDKIKNQKNYNNNRNILSIPTSLLSAYIKFGCISIREVYWEIVNNFGKENDLLAQIYWREFYYYIAYYFPDVLKGGNFNKKYDKIKWFWSENYFDKWCKGETGYPIVDAGMRELNKTGYLHNRSRLITSNFLNRILRLDWRWSELYYARMLTDYDPAVNNGNHQWIASVGVDPKPYFQRLFNPWLQSKKYDKDCEYIKKWIPELKNIPNNEIHKWNEYYDKYDLNKIKYFKPIVNYKIEREKSVEMYRKVLLNNK